MTGVGPVPREDPVPDSAHWFAEVADHLGEAYLRYSFTKGTAQEVGFLVTALDLRPGERILDLGCGPGRHARALAGEGLEVVGIDISDSFIGVARRDAPEGCEFRVGDARRLDLDGEFDAAVSLCQGAFGLGGPPGMWDPQGLESDRAVLDGLYRALRPGGRCAVSAFSAYFQVRWLEGGEEFDAASGILHEHTLLRSPEGEERAAELWTTGYTPRELRLLFEGAGFGVDRILGATPGGYSERPPDLELEEFLVIAARPGGSVFPQPPPSH